MNHDFRVLSNSNPLLYSRMEEEDEDEDYREQEERMMVMATKINTNSSRGYFHPMSFEGLYSDDEEEKDNDDDVEQMAPISPSFYIHNKEESPSGFEVVPTTKEEETSRLIRHNRTRSSSSTTINTHHTQRTRASLPSPSPSNSQAIQKNNKKKKNRLGLIFRRKPRTMDHETIKKSHSSGGENRPTWKLKHPQVLLPNKSCEYWLDRMMTQETLDASLATGTFDEDTFGNVEVLIANKHNNKNKNNEMQAKQLAHSDSQKSFAKTPLLRTLSHSSGNEIWAQRTIASHKQPQQHAQFMEPKPGKAADAGKEQLIGTVKTSNNTKGNNCAATMATPKTEHSPVTTDTSGPNSPVSNSPQEEPHRKVLTPKITSLNVFSELAHNLLRDLSWSSSSAGSSHFSRDARQLLEEAEAEGILAPKFEVPTTIYVHHVLEAETEKSQADSQEHQDKFVEDVERRLVFEKKRSQQHEPKATQPKDLVLQKLRKLPTLLRPPPRHHDDVPLAEVIVPPPFEKGDDDGCSAITDPDYGAKDDYASLSFCASDYSPDSAEFLDVD